MVWTWIDSSNLQVRVRLTEFSGSGSLAIHLSTLNLLTHACMSFVFRLTSLCWQLTSLNDVQKSQESLFPQKLLANDFYSFLARIGSHNNSEPVSQSWFAVVQINFRTKPHVPPLEQMCNRSFPQSCPNKNLEVLQERKEDWMPGNCGCNDSFLVPVLCFMWKVNLK